MEPWYQTYLFPTLLDKVMQKQVFVSLRAELLQGVRGQVLELGFGSGLSLAHYPPEVSELEGFDLSAHILEKAKKRLGNSSIEVHLTQGDGAALPCPTETNLLTRWFVVGLCAASKTSTGRCEKSGGC